MSDLGSAFSGFGVFLCSGGTIGFCSDNFSASNTALLSASLIPSSVISDISWMFSAEGFIPVISFNLFSKSLFKSTVDFFIELLYSVLLGKLVINSATCSFVNWIYKRPGGWIYN